MPTALRAPAALLFGCLGAASASNLTCPHASSDHLARCYETVFTWMGCCLWDEGEDLFGSAFIVNILLAMGLSSTQATIAGDIKCSGSLINILASPDDCSKAVKDVPLLAAAMASYSGTMLNFFGTLPVSMGCPTVCKDTLDGQAATSQVCSNVTAAAVGEDPDVVYACSTKDTHSVVYEGSGSFTSPPSAAPTASPSQDAAPKAAPTSGPQTPATTTEPASVTGADASTTDEPAEQQVSQGVRSASAAALLVSVPLFSL